MHSAHKVAVFSETTKGTPVKLCMVTNVDFSGATIAPSICTIPVQNYS